MTTDTGKNTKTGKRARVVDALRQRILTGQLSPGHQLPSREALVACFAVSPVTVQQALEQLKSDGFVYGRQGAGVFVVDHPPHLTHFALAFYDHPHGSEYERFSRFFQALNAAGNDYQDEHARRVSPFYNCNGLCESPNYCQLADDVYAQRVAGLIFAFPPHRLPGSPLVTFPHLPRVAIGTGEDFGIPAIGPDHEEMLRQAVAHLAQHGRRRIASISHENNVPRKETLFGAMQQCGLPVVPYWHQCQDHLYPEAAFNCAQLLLNPNQTERPDALFIADDNLAEAAVAGVTAAGVRVPEEVEVIVHCNWPLPPKTVLPVTRIGFDCRELLEASISELNRQRQGRCGQGTILMPPKLEG